MTSSGWACSIKSTAGPTFGAPCFNRPCRGPSGPGADRLFFLAFRAIFDFEALPYHAWIFATQIAAGVVLMSVVRRLTGSRTAAFLAPSSGPATPSC